MPKPKHFTPKPTTYQGVRFRSRVEAKWAVYLDNCPGISEWEYEPKTVHHPGTGWSYTPDFRIWAPGLCPIGYLEIKPGAVTTDYRRVLVDIWGQYLSPLFLLTGNFWDCPAHVEQLSGKHPIRFPLNAQALVIASSYRFDLADLISDGRKTDSNKTNELCQESGGTYKRRNPRRTSRRTRKPRKR